MASVTLEGVGKVYSGGVEAVRNISIAVPDGKLCVLVGPSGCGKSTLLRMIAGLETISSGTVRIGERVVNDVEPAERDIAMVFQNYALYPHMSVYDNMAYGLRNRGTPKPEIEARVQEAARILAIEALLGRKPKQLSGGQRQRVAMGRAIVRKPQVFLFDEPLSNLDAKLRTQMRVEIRRLQRSLGVTSVYVTHDQVEAMTLSDVLVVMNAGRVEQVGAPVDLYRRPGTRFVAGFLGSPAMNFIPAVVDGGRLSVDGQPFVEAPVGATGPVEVGIRPEDFRLVGEGEPHLPMVADFLEELGATELVHGRLGGADAAVQIPTGKMPADGVLRLAVDPASLHLFDAASGLRVGD